MDGIEDPSNTDTSAHGAPETESEDRPWLGMKSSTRKAITLWRTATPKSLCATLRREQGDAGGYPYNDTSRTYASNTRIYGGAKGRFHLSTATAKPRFYVGRFGQHTQVTL